MKKSIWVKGKKEYYSKYIIANNDRVFQLVPVTYGKVYSFESWQMAVKYGFKKVK
jgi:hypothetical protein